MKEIKPSSVLLAILLFASPALFAQDDASTSTLVKVGGPSPAFTTTSLSGKPLSSDELKGKVVLVNFWATWCGPCQIELPRVQKEICDGIKDTNFVLLCISRGEQKEVVQKFIGDNKYTFPVYLDSDTNTYRLFATRYIPRNFVVGRDGKVKWTSIGFNTNEFEEMVKLISTELKN